MANDNRNDLKSLTQHLRLICVFIVSIHHKWNGARLLSPEVDGPSCPVICCLLRILRNEEILGKSIKVEGRQPRVQSPFPKEKFGDTTRKLNNISYQAFHKSPTLLDFIDWSWHILLGIVWEKLFTS